MCSSRIYYYFRSFSLLCGIFVVCTHVTRLDWITPNWSCSYQILHYDVLALLHCLLFGMFLHYVCLEGIGSDAHVVAVFTGKGPLPSVRLHVFFKTVRLNAGKVALVTLKRPLP